MSTAGSTDARRHARVWHGVLWLALTTVVVTAILLTRITAVDARAAQSGHAGQGHGTTLSLVLLGVGLVTAVAWWRLRRRSSASGSWLPIGALGAAISACLGAAGYGPCSPPVSAVYTVPGWVLELYVGVVETGGPGSACANALPGGFMLARTIAIGVTVLSAVGVVLVLARQQVDRWRVVLSGDVDVVIGLDQMSLRLVQALAAENHSRTERDPWINRRPGFLLRQGPMPDRQPGWSVWWLTGLRPGDLVRLIGRPPKTVVVESDPNNPFLAASRRAGAIVVVGEATDPRLLRSVLTRRTLTGKRRTALRRLYAVDGDQSRNLAVFDVADQQLRTTLVQLHVRHLVPRLFVRMADAREARQWRAARAQHLNVDADGGALADRPGFPLVSDSLAVEEIAAEELARRIVISAQRDTTREQQVVLLGEGDLSLTLLDELAWQLWCKFECKVAEPGTSEQQPRTPSVPLAVTVVLAGPNAERRCGEWHDLRAPWRSPLMPLDMSSGGVLEDVAPKVVSGGSDGEGVAARVLEEDGNAIVIVVGDGAADCAAAARLARRWPADGLDGIRVVLHNGIPGPSGAVVAGGLHHSSPSLVRFEGKRERPPHDSVTRMARQQHEVYLSRLGWHLAESEKVEKDPHKSSAQSEWLAPLGGSSTDREKVTKASAERLTRVGWGDLPAFFQEDNVRQHWLVVSQFDWQPVYRKTPNAEAPDSWLRYVTSVAQKEYERWANLRRERGWWQAEKRHDTRRMHPDLRGWETSCNKTDNENQVRDILQRLWASGLAPVPRPVAEQAAAAAAAETPHADQARSSVSTGR